MFDKTYIN